MFRITITSEHNTFIECIYCQTLRQAYRIKEMLQAIGLVAKVFNIL